MANESDRLLVQQIRSGDADFRGATFSGPVLLTRVQHLNQLVTVKYVLEKIVNYKDMQWYGDSTVLFVAHGVVKAGVDLDMLKPGDLEVRGQTVRLDLPPPRVTDVYLDDHQSEVVERSTGLLRRFDKNLEQDARVIAVDDLRRAAEKNGILADASDRAKIELTSLFFGLGFTNVDVRVRP